MRRSLVVLTVASLSVAGLAVPVVGVVTLDATPVAPTTWSIALAGVDATAAALRGALDPAVDNAGVAGVAIDGSGTAADGGHLVALTPQRTTDPFMVAGVTWDAGSQVDVTQVALRLHEAGSWSPWTLMEVSDDVDDAELEAQGVEPRDGTEPLTSTGADGVQARVLTADGTVPANLAVELINPGDSDADDQIASLPMSSARADTATATVLKPAIVTRGQWGADEKLASSWANYSNGLKALYVHHTAGTNSYTAAQSPQLVRGIYAYHTKAMRWPDIGYQYLVDKFGTVYQGRRDAVTDLPVGAQAGGYNSQTIGISAMGNYSTAKPSAVMVTAIENVLAWKAYQYDLDPTGTTTLTTGTSSKSQTRHKDGQKVKVNVIQGHRDTNLTACPGTYLYAKLPEIRTAVASKVEAARNAYGTAQEVLAAPKITKKPLPVVFTSSAKVAWKKVSGAVRYQVVTQPTTYKTAATRNQSWWLYKTVTGTSASVSLKAGASRVIGVRAVDAQGRLSAVTLVSSTGRAVARSALKASKKGKKAQWATKKAKAYITDKAFVSSKKGATLKVTGVKATNRVVLRGATGPKAGKITVSLGGWKKTVSLKAKKTDKAGKVSVKLGANRSGTLVLTKKDSKKTELSSVAFGRKQVAKPKVLASQPNVVAVAPVTVSALVTTPTTTVTWSSAAKAKKYWVYTRTATTTGVLGPWVKVRSTTGLSYTLTMPTDGGEVHVGVSAVISTHARAAVSTRAILAAPLDLGAVAVANGLTAQVVLPGAATAADDDGAGGAAVPLPAWYTTPTGSLTAVGSGADLVLPAGRLTTRLSFSALTGSGQGSIAVVRKDKVIATIDLSTAGSGWHTVTMVATSTALSLRSVGDAPVTVTGVALQRG